jgi:hypothetical protein
VYLVQQVKKLHGKSINPSGEELLETNLQGAFQDIFFITTLDKTSKFIDAMYD